MDFLVSCSLFSAISESSIIGVSSMIGPESNDSVAAYSGSLSRFLARSFSPFAEIEDPLLRAVGDTPDSLGDNNGGEPRLKGRYGSSKARIEMSAIIRVVRVEGDIFLNE